MSARCPIHQLATGPDGTCVLCRRAETPEHGTSGVWLGVGAAALVILALAALALTHLNAPLEAEASRAAAEPREPAEPAPQVIEEPRAPDPAERAPVPTPAFPAEPTPAPTKVDGPREPDATELRAARRRVQVTLYTTSWCPHCERARRWLQASSVSFTELDVERSESAKREMRRINPGGGVPTLDIDGKVLVGFNPQTAERALDGAARARLMR
jgi:glutaredoxin